MDVFHATFDILFVFLIAVRVYYHSKARTWQRGPAPDGAIVLILRVLVGTPLLVGIFVYVVRPQILDWSSFPLGPSWRWAGAGIFGVSLPLLIWVQQSLGTNFSPELRIRSDQTLVTSGPYRYVRHPMYTLLLLMFAGMGLLTANWFIGGVGVFAIAVIMLSRTPREEEMMVKAFGDQYRRYAQTTGKFIPRLRRLA